MAQAEVASAGGMSEDFLLWSHDHFVFSTVHWSGASRGMIVIWDSIARGVFAESCTPADLEVEL